MKKIIGFIIFTLLIATYIIPIIGNATTINLKSLKKDFAFNYYLEDQSGFEDEESLGVWINMIPNEEGGNFGDRERHGMTYYESVNRTILTHGIYTKDDGTTGYYDCTWSYDFINNTWTNMSPNYIGGKIPTGLMDFSLVYDSNADKIILYGGRTYPWTYYNNTWTYDYESNSWANINPSMTGDIPRKGSSYQMTYDSNADRTIMFGGYDGFIWTNETWEYDYNTNTWTNLTPTMTTVGGPLPAILDGQLVYNSQADRSILFGGYTDRGQQFIKLNETWEYNYNTNTWTNLTPTMKTVGGWLEPRSWHHMTYDSNTSNIIMFSGNKGMNTQLNDTWFYNYTINTLYKIKYTSSGGILWPREASGMAYDSTNKIIILMGGLYAYQGIFDDTWILRYNINLEDNQAPNTPEKPEGPVNLNQDQYGTYTTSATDPDGDQAQYQFDWDANGNHDYSCWTGFVSSGAEVSLSHSWDVGGSYVVKACARDFYGNISGWSTGLTVVVNSAPNNPSNPDPPDGAIDVDINADLSWDCSDPEGDSLTYDVYFEGKLVSNNQSKKWYDPGTLEYDTDYYWQIVAWDEDGASTEGPIWSFTTCSYPNSPPNTPSDPEPEDGATDIDVDVDLSWNCSDPDGDSVTYDVYLDILDPPEERVSDNQNETTFDPETLEFVTTYYWQIIAKDEHGASTPGSVWQFTTRENMPPSAPSIDGPSSGKTNVGYDYIFATADPEGHDISYFVDWGDDKITDWTDFESSGTEKELTYMWTKQGTYIIKAKAKDIYNAESNWSEFEVTIPRTRTPFNSLLYWFLERFPMLERLLELIRTV